MTAAAFAALGAVFGAIITGTSAVIISYYQRQITLREEHKLRAFERHLPAYEKIFSACRSVQDALNDYVAVDEKAYDRSDPFLQQVLDVFKDCGYKYCMAVDWRHNPGMAYLDIELEERCLHLRDLLLMWLSIPRISYGDVITVRQEGEISRISAEDARRLGAGDYEELRIERQVVIVSAPNDPKLISSINQAATSVIKDIKAVMSH